MAVHNGIVWVEDDRPLSRADRRQCSTGAVEGISDSGYERNATGERFSDVWPSVAKEKSPVVPAMPVCFAEKKV